MKSEKNLVGLLIITFVLAGISLPSLAQSDNNLTTPEKNNTVDTSDSSEIVSSEQDNSILNKWQLFFRLMLAIAITIALGITAIYFSKKILPKIAKSSGKTISVIETVHLGPRKSLHIIEIGNRRILIGSTNENINTLADITNFPTDFSPEDTNVDY